MKVVHLSTRDIAGGAAKAAYRLHTLMRQSGIESKMFVLSKELSGNNDIETVSLIDKKIMSLIRGGINQLYNKPTNSTNFKFSNDIVGVDASKYIAIKQADIIYIHWTVSNFLTTSQIKKILRLGKPVYWVLHDMWTITGGCHYSFDCNQYMTNNCSNCPVVSNSRGKSIVRKSFISKLKAYKFNQNLTIVTPSKWLAQCAKESKLLKNTVVIPIANVLDRSIFKKIAKQVPRSLFGVDENVKLILFIAEHGTNNPYKGWSYLESALNILASKRKHDFEVLILGSDKDSQIVNSIPFKTHFCGRLYDEYSLSLAYNAADLFITPSLADNLPNTVLESLSCATPVVAFNVGGIPDMVIHKMNGYLAEYKNTEDLVQGIEYVLENKFSVSLDKSFNADSILSIHQELWRQHLPQKNKH